MDNIIKSICIALLAVVICLFLTKQNKDIAIIISLMACCGIMLYAMGYLEAILIFMDDLKALGNLDAGFFGILLKAVGIGLISEIASMLCMDAGYSALGKTVQIMSACCILWISLPLFSSLLELLNNILGEV